jgi:hypothetical protein
VTTFMDDYRAGAATAEQVDDWVDLWHDDPNPFGPKLHEFLGLTWDEYKRWAESGELPAEEGT